MNNYTYIANESRDMFDIAIPAFDAGTITESPSLNNYEKPSELEQFAAKSFTSFGTMAICIVVILIIAFIIKKKKDSDVDYNTSDVIGYKQQPEEIIQEEEIETEFVQNTSERKRTLLNTPSSIHKCIISFLENTKEN